MPADDNEGFGPGQLKECNFYFRLLQGCQGLLTARLLNVKVRTDVPLATVVELEMPKMTGDLWHLSESRRDRLVIVQLLSDLVDDISYALHRLHASGIFHRDVKPGNFLFDRNASRFYLIDFGSANFECLKTRTGGWCTYAYSAPEAGTERTPAKDSAATDIYSFGASLISLIVQYGLKVGDHHLDWKKILRECRWPTSAPVQWKRILERMVETDPEARPDLLEVRHAFGLPGVPDQWGHALVFREFPVVSLPVLDETMNKEVDDFGVKRKLVYQWIRDVAQMMNWDKLTYIAAVQVFNDYLMAPGRLKIEKAGDLQTVACAVMGLAHKCLEDEFLDIPNMADLGNGSVMPKRLFDTERDVWRRLEGVVTRRKPCPMMFQGKNWDEIVEYVINNSV